MQQNIKQNIYKCVVIDIKPTYIIVSHNNIKGICHISEISDYLVKNINDFFQLNKTYDFLLINADIKLKKYHFSYKRIHPKCLKHHYEIIETPSGFQSIYNQTISLLK